MFDQSRQRPVLQAVQPGVKLQLTSCEKAQDKASKMQACFILRSWQNRAT